MRACKRFTTDAQPSLNVSTITASRMRSPCSAMRTVGENGQDTKSNSGLGVRRDSVSAVLLIGAAVRFRKQIMVTL